MPDQTRLKIILVCCLCACSAQLLAAPAFWYQWRSKFDGAIVCSQTPLGSGWEVARGPFKDSHCEKPVLAK
jgi:hypothetical protein